jgi:hypothetical protein
MSDELRAHYRTYFEILRQKSGPLPESEYRALVERAMTQIEAHLAQRRLPAEGIAAHLAAAREASGLAPDEASARPSSTQEAHGKPNFFHRYPFPILVAAFLLLYALCVLAFLNEGVPKVTVNGTAGAKTPMEIEFIAVDLVRDAATLFVLPNRSAKQLLQKGVLLEDIDVEIDTGDQVLSHRFKAGTTPIPWHAVVPFDRGDQLDYPFDRHGGDFTIRVKRAGDPGSLPDLEIDKIAHGFSVNASAEPTEDGQELRVDYEVRRSGSVLFVAIFALLSLTLVCGSAVNVAWHVVRNGRKVEFSMMVWIAALLFVIPTVRNGLPGGPPHGALVDVALIYWLHFLTVSALLGVVWAWTRNR